MSKVDRLGYRAREIRVEVLPDALYKKEISLGEIIAAIRGQSIRATIGSFESYTSKQDLVTLAQFREPKEVGDVIVRSTFYAPRTKVKDLAIIKDDFKEENVLSRINGEAANSLIAYKSSSADIIRLVDTIRAMFDSERQYLPIGVKMLITNDKSTYVRSRFSIVLTNGAMGLILVLLVLALYLNVRTAFWVVLGIPVAILGTIFFLPVFGSFIDSITMTAMILALGIIVDDAIIISENIYQNFEQGASPVDAAIEGVSQVFKPVLTTILTTCIAFTPLFFMPGMLGKFVYVIPLVIFLALFVSLVESTIALTI